MYIAISVWLASAKSLAIQTACNDVGSLHDIAEGILDYKSTTDIEEFSKYCVDGIKYAISKTVFVFHIGA